MSDARNRATTDVAFDIAFDVVAPTIGRASLARLLDALAAAGGPLPGRVIVVDDRRDRRTPLLAAVPARLGDRVEVLPGRAAGPAAARNLGWRASAAPWIAFLDDDVEPASDWLARLVDDLRDLPPDVAGSQGRIDVPHPPGRRPTDWERNVAGLAEASWATADMAYRRAVLARVGGFDERFPRAYREDADLALRVLATGAGLVAGPRRTTHPVRPAGPWASVRAQAGNADDVLMRAVHGRGWRRRIGGAPGTIVRHVATTAVAALALGAAAARRPALAVAGAGAFAAAAAELAWRRIAPGPRTPREVATMVATSAVLPIAATAHRLRGLARLPRLLARGGPVPRPDAVLLDRDGTLVEDVPYNGDPARVQPMPGARAALDRLRAAGIPLAVISNQSGVACGLLTPDDVARVNDRIEELLGPIGPWFVCPHSPDDGCACRKPAPGMLLRAAATLGVPAERCALVGDIGADVEAARAVGARAVLVPTPRTLETEILAAPEVAPDLARAVDLLLGGSPCESR
jgi:histidinol-phosphate phosphatase family protein